MDKKESLMARRHGMRRYLTGLGIAISSALVAGCATTTGGGQNMPPQIPEGKGHLILDAGGIKEMNFFVISQETEQQVFSYMPRASAMSPSAYERSAQEFGLHTYLDPGIYTVVVNTDLEADTIEIPDVEVKLGEEKWVRVQVGRFMLNVTRGGEPAQVRFLIYDYNLRTVLGQGLTSTQVKHFIARPGIYKVWIEMQGAGSVIRDVEVSMGRVSPMNIELLPGTQEEPTDQAQEP